MNVTMTELPVRILHLSDLHFSTRSRWDSDPILCALARFIAADVTDNGLHPDLVVITGDLAQSGKPKEYGLARQWLDDLWPRLTPDPAAPLDRDRLLLVPGNHDVDWDLIEPGARDAHQAMLDAKDQKEITSRLDPKSVTCNLLLKRHAAYLKFYGDWLGQRQTWPWWQRSIPIRDQRLHVAGLDSAWLAERDDDSRLLLSTYQINQTVLHKDAKAEHDWRLALLHHPWASLAEFDRNDARRTLHRYRDLILSGHLHQPDLFRIAPADPRRSCIEAAAGCCYSGKPYPNAFQWIELYAQPRRVQFHFRCWNQDDWQVDRNQHGCPDGFHGIDLPPRAVDARVKTGAGGAAASGKARGAAPEPQLTDPIRADAIDAIAESLDLVPPLRDALALCIGAVPAATARAIAEWLCPPQAEDFLRALSACRAALQEAAKQLRQRPDGLVLLRERAYDILGWMVVTTVVDGYAREDAALVKEWARGAAFHIPLGRSLCLEVLSARWRKRRAEFGVERQPWQTGRDDITPGRLSAIGMNDPTRIEQGLVVDRVWCLLCQSIDGGTEPLLVDAETKDRIRERLAIQLEDEGRRRRLVIDSADLSNQMIIPSALEAIGRAIPEIHVIVIGVPDQGTGGAIFLLPAGRLAGNIEECLTRIESLGKSSAPQEKP